ncbi:MAG: hypothetical protein QM729_21295 [Solirubrobacterales bacterium]
MDLDADTREMLGYGDLWSAMLEGALVVADRKRAQDRVSAPARNAKAKKQPGYAKRRAEYKRRDRANMTPEQRAIYNAKAAARVKASRAKKKLNSGKR